MKWLIYGARPLYTPDLIEVIFRRGDTFVGAVDNLPTDQAHGGSAAAWLSPEDFDRETLDFDAVALSAGPPGIRKVLRDEVLSRRRDCFENLTDPTSTIASTATLSRGVTINANVVVGADAVLEEFIQINRSASVGHHTQLGPFVTLGPGVTVCSSVTVGPGAFVGAGATILPGMSIGENATVGAGSVITQDVPAYAVVVGNPAKILRIADTGYGGFIV